MFNKWCSHCQTYTETNFTDQHSISNGKILTIVSYYCNTCGNFVTMETINQEMNYILKNNKNEEREE